MSREWKVGDLFSVEGVITETADSAGDYPFARKALSFRAG